MYYRKSQAVCKVIKESGNHRLVHNLKRIVVVTMCIMFFPYCTCILLESHVYMNGSVYCDFNFTC